MAYRGNESGMEYEWSNGIGPIDDNTRSPFAALAHNAQRFGQSTTTKKRTYSAFDSPQKPQTPSRQNSPSKAKALPPIPFQGSQGTTIWSTPHKQNTEFDDSSAGETPRSPEHDDSNAATPENMGLRNALTTWSLGGGNQQSQPGAERAERDASKLLERERERERERPSPVRRDSWMVRFKDKISSPGRDRERRVKKRREQKYTSRKRQHSVSDSGEDNELQHRKSPRKASGQHRGALEGEEIRKPHWLSELFTFIGQHPTVPHILSFYAQLAFNVFLLAACAYMLFCFWSAVQGDVDKKSYEAMAEVMAESAQCLHEWTTNNCDRSKRVPALETMCENWQLCMNRDASKIARAKVSAHTFAEIFNSFVEPISWKAMVFTTFIVFGGFATTNMAFGFFRDKASHAHQQPPQYFPPPTPQRSFSGQPGEGYWGTPWHQPPAALEPQPSPVRRIAYN